MPAEWDEVNRGRELRQASLLFSVAGKIRHRGAANAEEGEKKRRGGENPPLSMFPSPIDRNADAGGENPPQHCYYSYFSNGAPAQKLSFSAN